MYGSNDEVWESRNKISEEEGTKMVVHPCRFTPVNIMTVASLSHHGEHNISEASMKKVKCIFAYSRVYSRDLIHDNRHFAKTQQFQSPPQSPRYTGMPYTTGAAPFKYLR